MRRKGVVNLAPFNNEAAVSGKSYRMQVLRARRSPPGRIRAYLDFKTIAFVVLIWMGNQRMLMLFTPRLRQTEWQKLSMHCAVIAG